MKSALKFGITIGILCAIWQIFMAVSGWMTNPRMFSLFYFVIVIEIACLIWGLKQTASTHGYGAQLATGAGMSLVAGVFLFLFSLLLTIVIFPNLVAEVTAMQVSVLREAGRPEPDISAFVALQKPVIMAAQGLVGTVITGVAATALIAIFLRSKK
jgi:hypothetical protein